jgi:energy-coupling factor transporter ATP-binding protein EcfA2
MLRSDRPSWDMFIEDMRSIFPGITISVSFNDVTDENIQAYFELPGGPNLPLDAAGTSILQASQILAYIGLFKPQVLILDEPDSHLHPDNQRALCDLIYNLASSRGFQAMISSHSRHVLDTMKNRSQVVWLSKGSVVKAPDMNSTTMLLDLGALDSVDYFADGETRCAVATEDSDTEPLRAILSSNDFVEDDTAIASYTGCTKIDAALVLGAFLEERAPNVHLVIHRDRDYMSNDSAESFRARLAAAEVKAFLTDCSDVEGYFLNPDHLHALNPGVTRERIEELLQQATNDTADKSVAAIVNQRTAEAFKRRQEGGPQPNHGDIAVRARADYDANPTEMRRGKPVLGRLQALLQQELGNNPRVFFPSPHLRTQPLVDLANQIWPHA